MLRLVVAVLAGFAPAAVTNRIIVWAADTVPTDPTSFLPSLGIGGAVAAVLYLWQRDTGKQRDRLMDQMAALLPALQESTAAHQASTKATEEMTELMRYHFPDPEPRRSRGRRGE